MKIDINLISLITNLFFTILGGVLAYIVFKKNEKKDNDNQVRHDAKIDVKLDNIAKNVDEIRLDNKDFSKNIHALGERVTSVEKEVKIADGRISKLENLHLEK